MNKDNESDQLKNSAITPDVVKEALDNLPHDFVKQAQAELKVLINEGVAKRNYSDSYISKVRKMKVENMDILLALVRVGQSNIQKKRMFGTIKKTSQTI